MSKNCTLKIPWQLKCSLCLFLYFNSLDTLYLNHYCSLPTNHFYQLAFTTCVHVHNKHMCTHTHSHTHTLTHTLTHTHTHTHTHIVDLRVLSASCADGDVRLNGGSNRAEGRLEVCFNNAWGSVCGPVSPSIAQVVCRQLGLLQSKPHVSVQFS